ncbi:uncharacterized protein LOC111627287 [Centruroides sculpturatus]|uniref:uncharacterized protein LOC111627287 n=1 Tax=Centruroides sculpturatus TaxID=218467 RepID=UPI000C6EE9CA|nr:uncharacterized protein LOC111627287 [Centruroides sculpturatus]
MKQTHLTILTPYGVFFDDPVPIVTVKTTRGYIGVQAGHTPLVAALDIAQASIGLEKSRSHKVLALGGGLMRVDAHGVKIVTPAAEFKDAIDLKRAETARVDAEKRLREEKLSTSQQIRYTFKLERALNRIKVARGE